MAERPQTLADVALTNLRGAGMGTVRAYANTGKVMSIVVMLAICAAEQEEWPTQAEYAAYWKVTDRTAQREWALFRQAFPQETSPDRLAQFVTSRRAKLVADRDRERLIADALKLPAESGFALA